jgi:hypothetical protein
VIYYFRIKELFFKLVNETRLYYDARSEKHQIISSYVKLYGQNDERERERDEGGRDKTGSLTKGKSQVINNTWNAGRK